MLTRLASPPSPQPHPGPSSRKGRQKQKCHLEGPAGAHLQGAARPQVCGGRSGPGRACPGGAQRPGSAAAASVVSGLVLPSYAMRLSEKGTRAVISRDVFSMRNVSFLFHIQQYTFRVENSGHVIAQKRLLQTGLLGVCCALPRLPLGGRLQGQEGGLALLTLALQIQKLTVGTLPSRGIVPSVGRDRLPSRHFAFRRLLTFHCERSCKTHPSGYVHSCVLRVTS